MISEERKEEIRRNKQMFRLMFDNAYWRVPRQIVKDLGSDAGVLFAALVDSSKQQDCFQKSKEELEDETGIPIEQQEKLFKLLVENGLLEIGYINDPSETWYRIDCEYWEQ